MKRLLLLFFISNLQVSFAQFTNILIDHNGDPNETTICVNPNNPQNIVGGANLNFTYQSNDGGLTWEKNSVSCPYGVWGDPCIISDTMGNFYFIHLSNPPNGNWIDRIVCQKSTDSGASWSNGSYTGLNGARAQDKAWAIFDALSQNIYVTWTQFDSYGSNDPADSSIILFSKSTDLGVTWSTPMRINRTAGDCHDSDGTVEGAVPAVSDDGKIYVAWSLNDTIYFDRSDDEGDTWLDADIAASSQPDGWDYNIQGLQRCNGLPVTKCDLSNSPYHGTIYINWTDQRNGSANTDVFIAKSTDNGNTWSDAVKVNDDTTQTNQFMSWMDVDQTDGVIYVVFYDRRNYVNKNTDVFLAYSTDGGSTFTNVKISEDLFSPSASVFLGDYTNISAYDGKVVPIWTREDGGQTSVWTAQIDIATLAETASPLATKHFMLYQNVPNPFSDITTIEMNIGQSGYYTLTLFDMMGRKIADLISNQFLRRGHAKITLDARRLGLNESAYYYSLRKDNEIMTKQLVIVNQ
ncbi:MAG TPA: hypothetical protein VE978_11215 [Chitinophagales bacterium]|nr:hypothetical protein [Chitinophagales bacterium]